MAIKKPDNWENVKAAAEREKLPVGAYICKILKAGVRTYESRDGSSTFEKLEIAFDIAEGDFTGHYCNACAHKRSVASTGLFCCLCNCCGEKLLLCFAVQLRPVFAGHRLTSLSVCRCPCCV